MREQEGYVLEDCRMQAENRIRNLMWTVSGDYSLKGRVDVEAFARNKYLALYDAVKQGAFARFFDADALSLYIMKKLYYGAEEPSLMSIAQLCAEAAVYRRILVQRPGVEQVRRKAFDAMREHQFVKLSDSFMGRVKLAFIRRELGETNVSEQRIEKVLKEILALESAEDTMTIIRVVDRIYNTAIDRGFERKHGDLEFVLATPMEELAEATWQDFLDEELYDSVMEQFLDQVSQRVSTLEDLYQESGQKRQGVKKQIVVLDQKALEKMNSYMQLNFGISYLTEAEQKRLNHRLCTDAHADCSLYYTDGILEHPVLANAQYVNAKKQADRNRLLLHNSQQMVRRNIEILTANLRRSLIQRTEQEKILSEWGTILPRRLWRIGRTESPKVFQKSVRANQSDFVVEILMDASGSQRDRQSQVALQGYIISEALSNVGIPHRVMGFCTFWDYTVMQRFREYDAPREENRKIFNFTTTANNRDGLAIRAAADSLMQRDEENKILIVLSDGRPNDVIVNRPNSRNPRSYYGDYAVRDTALELRRIRNLGVFVLGVFAGLEQDLAAEKKIFGRDFAYIRDIRNFSNVVGQYLQRLLEW